MYKHGFSIKKVEFSIYTVAELRVQWHHRQRQDLISVEWYGAVLRDGVLTYAGIQSYASQSEPWNRNKNVLKNGNSDK